MAAHDQDVNMEAPICSICHEPATGDDIVTPTGCSTGRENVRHYFHLVNCITPHAHGDSRCPSCRAEIGYLVRSDNHRALIPHLGEVQRNRLQNQELNNSPFVFYPPGSPELAPPPPRAPVAPPPPRAPVAPPPRAPVAPPPRAPVAPPPFVPQVPAPVFRVVPLAPAPAPEEPVDPSQAAVYRGHKALILQGQHALEQLSHAFTEPYTIGEHQPTVIPNGGELEVYHNQTSSQFASLKNTLLRSLKYLREADLKIDKVADRNYVERVKAADLARQEELRQQLATLQAQVQSVQELLHTTPRPRRRQRTT